MITFSLLKIFIGIAGIIGIYYCTKYIFSKKKVHDICRNLGLTAVASREMAFIATSALFLGYLFYSIPIISHPLLYFAWVAPIIGLFNVFINKQEVRNFLSGIPLIGEFLTCPLATEEKVEKIKKEMMLNKIDKEEIKAIQQCKFTCENCRGLDAIRIIVIWSLANIAIPYILRYLKLIR